MRSGNVLATAFFALAAVLLPLRAVAQDNPTGSPWQATEEEARAVIGLSIEYLQLYSVGDFVAAYGYLGESLRAQLPFSAYRANGQDINATLGALQETAIVGFTWYDNPASAPAPGVYAAVDFSLINENAGIHCGYLIWLRKGEMTFRLQRIERNYLEREKQLQMSQEDLAAVLAHFGCQGR